MVMNQKMVSFCLCIGIGERKQLPYCSCATDSWHQCPLFLNIFFSFWFVMLAFCRGLEAGAVEYRFEYAVSTTIHYLYRISSKCMLFILLNQWMNGNEWYRQCLYIQQRDFLWNMISNICMWRTHTMYYNANPQK